MLVSLLSTAEGSSHKEIGSAVRFTAEIQLVPEDADTICKVVGFPAHAHHQHIKYPAPRLIKYGQRACSKTARTEVLAVRSSRSRFACCTCVLAQTVAAHRAEDIRKHNRISIALFPRLCSWTHCSCPAVSCPLSLRGFTARNVTTQARYSKGTYIVTAHAHPRIIRLQYASCFGRGRRVPSTAHAMCPVKALLPFCWCGWGELFPLTESRGKRPTICTKSRNPSPVRDPITLPLQIWIVMRTNPSRLVPCVPAAIDLVAARGRDIRSLLLSALTATLGDKPCTPLRPGSVPSNLLCQSVQGIDHLPKQHLPCDQAHTPF